jgi:hypothetical protein
MTQPERDVQINISGIPVAGVGGLGLVAMAVLVSVVMPAARWTMVAGVIGGVLLAVVLVFARRRADKRHPGDRPPSVLFVEAAAEARERPSSTELPPNGGSYRSVRPVYSTR